MAIGQVILGVRDLDAASARLEADGLFVVDGGVHPGLGTANRVVPLGTSYLELLGVADEELAREHEYGRSLLRSIELGDRLVRWSIRTDHIARDALRLGISVERRQRVRPNGTTLSWRAAGLELSLVHAWLPFFMQWDAPSDFPGRLPVKHPVGECSLAGIEIATPDPAQLATWIEGAGSLPLRVVDGPAGILAAAISTPNGELVLRP